MAAADSSNTQCRLSVSSSACICSFSRTRRCSASNSFSSLSWLSATLTRCCSAVCCPASCFSSCSMRRWAWAISEFSSSAVSWPSAQTTLPASWMIINTTLPTATARVPAAIDRRPVCGANTCQSISAAADVTGQTYDWTNTRLLHRPCNGQCHCTNKYTARELFSFAVPGTSECC